jgi:CRP/FNR family transcriptional regulator
MIDSCAECQQRTRCLLGQLEPVHHQRVKQYLLYQKNLQPGDVLIDQGMSFGRLYLVRYGTFKRAVISDEGDQQIAGLHMAGDVLGFDGLERGIHPCEVSALEHASVCVFRFDHLCQIASEIGRVQQLLFRSLSRVMEQDRNLLMLLGHMDGEQRMAYFLLTFQQMHSNNNISSKALNLLMTRQEIGSYLGMTLESVSRNLSKFQKKGWIRVNRRQVEILSPAALATQVQGG